jgi:hypothetical protein
LPTSARHAARGGFPSGQPVSQPFSADMPLRDTPRHCGQSSACQYAYREERSQSNRGLPLSDQAHVRPLPCKVDLARGAQAGLDGALYPGVG